VFQAAGGLLDQLDALRELRGRQSVRVQDGEVLKGVDKVAELLQRVAGGAGALVDEVVLCHGRPPPARR
jgi:hypothetical protein